MPPRHDRRKRDKLLFGCTLICVICTVATVGVVAPTVLGTHHLGTQNQERIKDVARLERENQQAKDALCVFRSDLQARVDAGNEFLADHPDGIPGIPAKQFRTSLDNQQRTVSALRGLSCPKP